MPIPVPTIPGVTPELWSQLITALQAQGTDVATITEQGITTYEGLKAWLSSQGYEIIEISEVVGHTIMKVNPVDPANTNAVSTEVITDLTTVGGAGTAVSTITRGGNRTLGLVSKIVAVSACLSLLVSEIGAGLVTPEVQADLITSADPYTIDGENVLVMIDENGKSYFPSELIEAIRARAIELGVFDTGGIVPPPAEFTTKSIRPYTLAEYRSMGNALLNSVIDQAITDGIQLPEYFYIYVQGGTSSSIFMFYDPANLSVTANIISSLGDGFYNTSNYRTALDTYITFGGYRGVRYRYSDDQIKSINQGGLGSTITVLQVPSLPSDMTFTQNFNYVINPYAIGGGGGVEGITPAGDLISAGIADTTKTIGQVIPELETNKLQTASPTDEDITGKTDWYPTSINHSDVFTEGATEDETSTAPDGNVKPDLEPDIIDAIRDLIDTLNPNPTIPVGDSGDTPPENPPLTPGSGATGSNGLWSIYNPSLQAVHDFGAWLWSDTLADQFRRIFNSPIDGVIGFHMIYCTPIKGTAKNIQCGFLQSPVVSDTVANQYVEIDCGTVTIGEYYRNALDYDNTSIALYLPFIGIVPLDTNIVMGSDISILYRIDVLTGTCLAQVTVEKENSNAVMYAFDGNCSVQIPLTATTYTGMVGALLGGLSASVSFMAGDMFHAVTGAMSAMSSAMGGKTGVKQSGTMGANAGALGIRKPYVIITHPVTAMPAGFEGVRGLPSTELVTLGSVSGYTSVRDIHLEGIPATAEEINEIKELLAEGVIL